MSPSDQKDLHEEKPVFVLGVDLGGRRMIKKKICRTADIWVWGEHGGILRTIFEWADQVRALDDLRTFTFPNSALNFRQFVKSPFQGNPTHLAWLNGFGEADVVDIERVAVRALLTKRLPRGKRRWGFKEIRYGIEDAVPDRLLELFPGAKIVHTVRHPARNVESAVFEWAYERLRDASEAGDKSTISEIYGVFASRWQRSAEYFMNLNRRHPGRVFTHRLEASESAVSKLGDFLEVDTAELGQLNSHDVINAGGAIGHPDNSMMLSQLRDAGMEALSGLANVAYQYGYEI